jgi:hypothetical protein
MWETTCDRARGLRCGWSTESCQHNDSPKCHLCEVANATSEIVEDIGGKVSVDS